MSTCDWLFSVKCQQVIMTQAYIDTSRLSESGVNHDICTWDFASELSYLAIRKYREDLSHRKYVKVLSDFVAVWAIAVIGEYWHILRGRPCAVLNEEPPTSLLPYWPMDPLMQTPWKLYICPDYLPEIWQAIDEEEGKYFSAYEDP